MNKMQGDIRDYLVFRDTSLGLEVLKRPEYANRYTEIFLQHAVSGIELSSRGSMRIQLEGDVDEAAKLLVNHPQTLNQLLSMTYEGYKTDEEHSRDIEEMSSMFSEMGMERALSVLKKIYEKRIKKGEKLAMLLNELEKVANSDGIDSVIFGYGDSVKTVYGSAQEFIEWYVLRENMAEVAAGLQGSADIDREDHLHVAEIFSAVNPGFTAVQEVYADVREEIALQLAKEIFNKG